MKELRQKREEFAIDIRNKMREETFKEHRQTLALRVNMNYELNGELGQTVTRYEQTIYQISMLQPLMNVFLDGSNPVEKRLEFLVAAIQLSQDDQEDSLYEGVVLELMVQSYSLLTLIKHCIYDENLPLIFRELTLKVATQLAKTTVQQVAILVDLEYHIMFLNVLRFAAKSRSQRFIIFGICNLMMCKVEHRNYFLEKGIYADITSLLEIGKQGADLEVFKAIAQFLNHFTREKVFDMREKIDFYLSPVLQLMEFQMHHQNDFDLTNDLIFTLYQMGNSILQDNAPNDMNDYFIELLAIKASFVPFVRAALHDHYQTQISSVRFLMKCFNTRKLSSYLFSQFGDDILKMAANLGKIKTITAKFDIIKLFDRMLFCCTCIPENYILQIFDICETYFYSRKEFAKCTIATMNTLFQTYSFTCLNQSHLDKIVAMLDTVFLDPLVDDLLQKLCFQLMFLMLNNPNQATILKLRDLFTEKRLIHRAEEKLTKQCSQELQTVIHHLLNQYQILDEEEMP